MRALAAVLLSFCALPCFAFTVTTSADSGPGSLRDAIARVNAECTSECTIDFDLPPGTLLEPLSPLPPITACAQVRIDAGSTTRAGDRRIELSGAKQPTGFGLHVRQVCTGGLGPLLRVDGLAVNRFPWDGIHVERGNLLCSGCFVGTDVTGRQARPNGGRGVSVQSLTSLVVLRESVLSGNTRSGLFVWEAREVRAENCSIGTTPDGLPLPNGASGIFIRRGFLSATLSTIAHNRDFALAVGSEATMLAFGNDLRGNGVQPIDYLLDGPTLHAPNMPDVPELIGATYDPATGKTTVTGRVVITRPGAHRHMVELYADGVSAITNVNLPFRATPGLYDFTIQHTGDLTGRYVTVTNSRGYDEQDGGLAETSEMSNAVLVTSSAR